MQNPTGMHTQGWLAGGVSSLPRFPFLRQKQACHASLCTLKFTDRWTDRQTDWTIQATHDWKDIREEKK